MMISCSLYATPLIGDTHLILLPNVNDCSCFFGGEHCPISIDSNLAWLQRFLDRLWSLEDLVKLFERPAAGFWQKEVEDCPPC